MKQELLRMEGISLGDASHPLIQELHLALYAGETLGIYSEQGAAKAALAGLLTGSLGALTGRLYIGREPCPFQEQDRFRYRKAGVIQGVNTLIDVLSISENIFVIRKGFRGAFISPRVLHGQTQQLMGEYGLSLNPKTLGGQLSQLERCQVELIKAVALGARVVILLDLASFLSDAEIQTLMGLTEKLKQRGYGLLMLDSSVSHLSRYGDRVTVLRNGKGIWTFGPGEFNDTQLGKCLFREPLPVLGSGCEAGEASHGSPVLTFQQVTQGPLKNLSFTLHGGEALCLLDRAGRGIEVVQGLLGGAQHPESGEIRALGEPYGVRSLWEALDRRVAFIAESPADAMVFPDFTALENLCFAAARKTRDFWINPRYLASCREEYAPYFTPGALERYPDQLAPQDLHTLAYCRWHLYNPAVVVCIKPFSSVDKSLEAISAFFMELLLKKGIGVLILTANASEAESTRRKIIIETSKE